MVNEKGFQVIFAKHRSFLLNIMSFLQNKNNEYVYGDVNSVWGIQGIWGHEKYAGCVKSMWGVKCEHMI